MFVLVTFLKKIQGVSVYYSNHVQKYDFFFSITSCIIS